MAHAAEAVDQREFCELLLPHGRTIHQRVLHRAIAHGERRLPVFPAAYRAVAKHRASTGELPASHLEVDRSLSNPRRNATNRGRIGRRGVRVRARRERLANGRQETARLAGRYGSRHRAGISKIAAAGHCLALVAKGRARCHWPANARRPKELVVKVVKSRILVLMLPLLLPRLQKSCQMFSFSVAFPQEAISSCKPEPDFGVR